MDDATVAGLRALEGTPFTKMTGSGNDFVVFDGREVDGSRLVQPEVIVAICNRHNGIGADGLVLLEPAAPDFPTLGQAPGGIGAVRLRYFNRDGSLGELCGNATLCSTELSVRVGLASPDHVELDTDSGRVSGRIVDGEPEIDLAAVTDVRPHFLGLPPADGDRQVGYARVGVPHVVIVRDELASLDVVGRGRPLRQHVSLAPDGANVNWVTAAGDGRWRYRTYERGVEDETLACGTGAIASAILLVEWGLATAPVELVTHSGQVVTVSFRDVENAAGSGARAERLWYPSLRGEGRVVFRGTISALS